MGTPSLQERVTALESGLSPSERRVARYLAAHPQVVAVSNATRLGELTETSNATVVRTVKSLGYDGLPDLRQMLVQVMADRLNPAAVLDRRVGELRSNGSFPYQVYDSAARLIEQAQGLLDAEEWNRAVNILNKAPTVVCYGIEQAGCVATVLAIDMTRRGKATRSITSTGIELAQDLLTLAPEDAVVIVAPLRHFREIDVIVDHAHAVGCHTILISEALGLALASRVDVVITTPQSTTTLANESVMPLVVVNALALEVASLNRKKAVATQQVHEQLRSAVTNARVDVDQPNEAVQPSTASRKRTTKVVRGEGRDAHRHQ